MGLSAFKTAGKVIVGRGALARRGLRPRRERDRKVQRSATDGTAWWFGPRFEAGEEKTLGQTASKTDVFADVGRDFFHEGAPINYSPEAPGRGYDLVGWAGGAAAALV